MKARSKHPTERGLREKNGKWEYRFRLRGRLYSQVTDLKAVPENVLQAQAHRAAHIEQARAGKATAKLKTIEVHHGVAHFMRWYVSEHPRGGKSKWARALMSSFEYFLTQHKWSLTDIGPAELESFKMWRRQNGIHNNTLNKQLLIIRNFFRHARKQGWIDTDPFARGQDLEVKIPAPQDSDVMHVLSPEEEQRYLRSARDECPDLHDVAVIMLEQGPRPDEVLSLRQAHVDLAQRHFTIWSSTVEGKTKSAHRKLKMTEATFQILARRLSRPGLWVFPSSKNNGRRTTLQKAHVHATRGRKNSNGEYEGGSGVECRLYDMRHTFATRFALAGGLLPVLSKILGHADLSMLNKYVHPSQADMDRAMEWYAQSHSVEGPGLKDMLLEFQGPESSTSDLEWPRPLFRPLSSSKAAQADHSQPYMVLGNRSLKEEVNY